MNCTSHMTTRFGESICFVTLGIVSRFSACPCADYKAASDGRPQRSEDGTAAQPPLPPATNRGGKIEQSKQTTGDESDEF